MSIKSRRLEYIVFVLPLLLALICLLSVTFNHHQASLPIPMPQEFIGEYSYDGENWQTLTEKSDISALKGDLYLGELWWLSLHLDMKLFRLGRLQFGFGKALMDIPQYGLKKDDPVIDIHIPEGEPLSPEKCDESIENAKVFFKKYFPEFQYKCFTCHSWLLDDTLDEILPPTSNLIAFKSRFDRVHKEKDYMLLRYIFRWDTNETNLKYAYPVSEFASKVKKRVLSGEDFYLTYGILK